MAFPAHGRRWPHGWTYIRFGGLGALALEEIMTESLGLPAKFIWKPTDRHEHFEHTDNPCFMADWRTLFHPTTPLISFYVYYVDQAPHYRTHDLHVSYIDPVLHTWLPGWNVRTEPTPAQAQIALARAERIHKLNAQQLASLKRNTK